MIYQLTKTGSLVVLVIAIGGCSVFGTDLSKNGGVTVVTIPSDELSYLDVVVTQKGGEAEVAGEIRLDLSRGRRPVPGHMDLVIEAPTGEVLFIGGVPYHKPHPREQYKHARFEVSIHKTLPKDTVVTLKHHGEPMDVHMPWI